MVNNLDFPEKHCVDSFYTTSFKQKSCTHNFFRRIPHLARFKIKMIQMIFSD